MRTRQNAMIIIFFICIWENINYTFIDYSCLMLICQIIALLYLIKKIAKRSHFVTIGVRCLFYYSLIFYAKKEYTGLEQGSFSIEMK